MGNVTEPPMHILSVPSICHFPLHTLIIPAQLSTAQHAYQIFVMGDTRAGQIISQSANQWSEAAVQGVRSKSKDPLLAATPFPVHQAEIDPTGR